MLSWFKKWFNFTPDPDFPFRIIENVKGDGSSYFVVEKLTDSQIGPFWSYISKDYKTFQEAENEMYKLYSNYIVSKKVIHSPSENIYKSFGDFYET